MADCTRCGRKLPAISFGSGGLCDNCRQAEQDEIQPGGHASQLISPWSTGPAVTMAIMGLNIAVYLAMVLNGVSATEPSVQDSIRWGALAGPLAFGTENFPAEPWRVLTSIFEHGGLFHIGMNMWCLWNVGRLAEQIYDKGTYLWAYLLCGVGGCLACLWWSPMSATVGASGAIFGVVGLLITTFWLGKLPISRAQTQGTLYSLMIFVGYSLYFGAVTPRTSNSAHIGGLFTGLILGGLMAPFLTHDRRESQGIRWLILAGAAAALVALFHVLKVQALNS